jgi:hypothetical protein
MSVWLILPPNSVADEYEKVGQRIIGPVDYATAESVAKNIHRAFERAACEVHTRTLADD